MWRSIHPQHAIERLRVDINLSEALPPKVLTRMAAEFDSIRDDLGFSARTETQVANIDLSAPVTPSGAVKADVSKGWMFARTAATPPDAPIEAYVVTGNSIVYENTEYTRWGEISQRYYKIVGGILDIVASDYTVASVALSYYDRFYFDGPVSNARIQALIKEQLLSSFPPPTLRGGGPLFHLHRGWFEGEDQKILINQNLDLQDGVTPAGATLRSAALLTKSEIRSDLSREPEGVDLSNRGPIFDLLHARNKAAFSWALSNDMREALKV